jgi:hypothetical protein
MRNASSIAAGLLGLAFHIFVTKSVGLTSAPLVLICLLAAFVLWSERKSWAGLFAR